MASRPPHVWLESPAQSMLQVASVSDPRDPGDPQKHCKAKRLDGMESQYIIATTLHRGDIIASMRRRILTKSLRQPAVRMRGLVFKRRLSQIFLDISTNELELHPPRSRILSRSTRSQCRTTRSTARYTDTGFGAHVSRRRVSVGAAFE